MDGQWTKSDHYSSSWAQLRWAKNPNYHLMRSYEMQCEIFRSIQLLSRKNWHQFDYKPLYSCKRYGTWQLSHFTSYALDYEINKTNREICFTSYSEKSSLAILLLSGLWTGHLVKLQNLTDQSHFQSAHPFFLCFFRIHAQTGQQLFKRNTGSYKS